MPLVSVIMPVYNVATYVRTSATSVLTQDLVDLELILVDDGSTDGSAEICDALAKEDVRVRVLHQVNAGVAAARNAGLAVASGRFLMFCDADDVLRPNACRRMTSVFEDRQVDAVVCRTDFQIGEDVGMDSVRRRIGDGGSFNSGKAGLVCAESREKFFGVHVALWLKAYRLDIIRRNGIRFPPVRRHEDDAFWIMYAMSSRDVIRIPDMLYVYRMRSDSLMAAEAAGRPCDKGDFAAAVDAVADFTVRQDLSDRFGWVVVTMAYNCYLQAASFLDPLELSELRDRLLARAEAFSSPRNRIVVCGDRLIRIARRGSPADLLAVGWHRFRAWCFSGNAAKRDKALRRAERNLLLWQTK